MKIALWTYDMSRRCDSYPDWLASLADYAKTAAAADAKLLMLPELVGLHWANYLCSRRSVLAEEAILLIARSAPSLVADLTEISQQHGISILAGTFPRISENSIVNQAILVRPDGRVITHEKLCLTPVEKSEFGIRQGETLSVFEIEGWRSVVLTCLDIEQPWLACQISQLDVDLVLVPSMTMTADGYHRVFSCAKSRAIELQAAVCVVGAVGDTPYTPFHATNFSGAAVFIPCEEPLGSSGTLLDVVPSKNAREKEGTGLHLASVPLSTIRAMRKGGARVWPGAWRPSDKFRVKFE